MTPADPATADSGREDDLVFPPKDLDQLLDIARFVENHTEPGLLLGPDGEQVPLPGRGDGASWGPLLPRLLPRVDL